MNFNKIFVDLNGDRTYDECVKMAHNKENAFILIKETEQHMYIKGKNDTNYENYPIVDKQNKSKPKVHIYKNKIFTIYNVEDNISYEAHNINFICRSSYPYKTTNHTRSTNSFIHYPPDLLKLYNKQIASQHNQCIQSFLSISRLREPEEALSRVKCTIARKFI